MLLVVGRFVGNLVSRARSGRIVPSWDSFAAAGLGVADPGAGR
jgi:hypothetical protein